ncbi:MAG: hypothetical protein JWP18_1166 [Solirubrobacterales bacterium]|nr:hypothetical protein [Solirubrobacterales bacterium]
MVSACCQRVRRAFILAVLTIGLPALPALTSSAAASVDCGTASAASHAGDLPAAARAVRCLVNAERHDHGLQPVRNSGPLERAATRHSRAMLRTGTFDHRVSGEPALRARVRSAGYLKNATRWWLGETLAYGSGHASSPAALVESLMASPPHRAIILEPQFRHIGVGLVTGLPVPGGGATAAGATLTLDFGRIQSR